MIRFSGFGRACVAVCLVAPFLWCAGPAWADEPCPPDTLQAAEGGSNLFHTVFSGSTPYVPFIVEGHTDSYLESEVNFEQCRGLVGIVSAPYVLGLRLSAADRYAVSDALPGGPAARRVKAHLNVTMRFDTMDYLGGCAGPEGRVRVRLLSPAGELGREFVILLDSRSHELDLVGDPFDVSPDAPFVVRTIFQLDGVRGEAHVNYGLKFEGIDDGALAVTSCNGFNGMVPVRPTTWSAVKALYR